MTQLPTARIYKVLNKQVYCKNEFSLVPIRHEDRYKIMQWRNEQLYHLRQTRPLTEAMQDAYFENVVAKLFEQEQPDQILFSYLKGDECIGYGGLVHINWVDKNAEVSLVMNTSLQELYFEKYWEAFATLVKQVAFRNLNLHKIYTYAFDLRPLLYSALEAGGFLEECRLKEHCLFDGSYIDVVYHGCINPIHNLEIRSADTDDDRLLYRWVNDPEVRVASLNSERISWETHLNWFRLKLNSGNCKIYIVQNVLKRPIGQIRIERIKNKWIIDYSIDKTFRGLGLGREIIKMMLCDNSGKSFRAEVKLSNKASQRVFQNLGFNEVSKNQISILYELSL